MKTFNCAGLLTILAFVTPLLSGCQSFQFVESPIPVTSKLNPTMIPVE